MVPTLKRFIYAASSDSELVIELPEIVEARVQVACSSIDDIVRSLASVKSLMLCLPYQPEVPTCYIFHKLEHFEFCTCLKHWDLVVFMLQHSPKLRSLKLNEIHGYPIDYETHMTHWDEPSSVPKTLSFVLETFEWRKYRGWMIERDLASFILKHARRLKIATFLPAVPLQMMEDGTTQLAMKYRMLMDLERLSKGSTECELVFG